MNAPCPSGTLLHQRYLIEHPLRQGRYDVTYLAIDLARDTPVAIKEMLDVFADPVLQRKAVQQFADEFRTLSRVSHPSLPKVFELFEENDRQFLVMEHVEARPLCDVLAEADELPSETHVLHWLWQLVDVLEFLHSQSPPVIYRDLQPSTIMITALGQVKLLDFGIAKMLDPMRQGRTLFRAVGSPEYAPPEAFGMSRSDPRTDVYALGASMYFALTGIAPPQAADRIIRQTRLLHIQQINPSVSDALQRVIVQMMSVKTVDRPDNMQMIRHMLDGFQQRPSSPTIQPPAVILPSPEGEKPVAEMVHYIPPQHLLPAPPPAPVVAAALPQPSLAPPSPDTVSPGTVLALAVWSVLMFALGFFSAVHF